MVQAFARQGRDCVDSVEHLVTILVSSSVQYSDTHRKNLPQIPTCGIFRVIIRRLGIRLQVCYNYGEIIRCWNIVVAYIEVVHIPCRSRTHCNIPTSDHIIERPHRLETKWRLRRASGKFQHHLLFSPLSPPSPPKLDDSFDEQTRVALTTAGQVSLVIYYSESMLRWNLGLLRSSRLRLLLLVLG